MPPACVVHEIRRREVAVAGRNHVGDREARARQPVAGTVERLDELVRRVCARRVLRRHAAGQRRLAGRAPGASSLPAYCRPAPAQQAARPEDEREEKQAGLDEDDRRAAGDVEPVGQVEADDRARDPDQGGEQHEPREPYGQHLRGRGGRHQHRDHEDDADGLQADHDRERDEREEQVLEPLDLDPRCRGAERVEGRVQELLPEQPDDREHPEAEDQQGDEVPGTDREDVAQQEANRSAT